MSHPNRKSNSLGCAGTDPWSDVPLTAPAAGPTARPPTPGPDDPGYPAYLMAFHRGEVPAPEHWELYLCPTCGTQYVTQPRPELNLRNMLFWMRWSAPAPCSECGRYYQYSHDRGKLVVRATCHRQKDAAYTAAMQRECQEYHGLPEPHPGLPPSPPPAQIREEERLKCQREVSAHLDEMAQKLDRLNNQIAGHVPGSHPLERPDPDSQGQLSSLWTRSYPLSTIPPCTPAANAEPNQPPYVGVDRLDAIALGPAATNCPESDAELGEEDTGLWAEEYDYDE